MARYVVDTSSLIELADLYPLKRFPNLWKKVDALVSEGRMSAPWQVYKEIERKDDELFRWASEHKEMFEKNSDEVEAIAIKLAKKYKNMRNKDEGERADAYVIALAHHVDAGRLDEKPVIVTEEGRKRGQIPRVAELYGLATIRIADVVAAEGLDE